MKETVTVIGPAGIDKDYAVVDSQKRILCECFGRVAECPEGYVNAKYLADKIAEMMNEGYNQPEVEEPNHEEESRNNERNGTEQFNEDLRETL